MSITHSLMARSIQRAIDATPVVHEDRISLQSAIESFESLVDGYQRVSGAWTSVGHLTQKFFADADITAEKAAQFEYTTEAILHAAGVVIPSDVMYASFENSISYSVEAGEKILANLKRVGEWLMNLLRQISESLKNVIKRFRTSASTGKAKLVALRDKLRSKGDKDEAKSKDDKGQASTEAADGSVQVPDIKILGGRDVKVESTISKAQENTRKAGIEILNIVRAVSETAKRFNPEKHSDTSGLDNYITDLMTSIGMEKSADGGKREFPIVNGAGVVMTFTKKSDATVSVRTNAMKYEKTPGEMPRLERDERLHLLDYLIAAYDKIDALVKPMDTASEIFNTMAGTMNSGYRSAVKMIADAKNDSELDGFSRLSRVYSTLGQIMHALANLPSAVFGNYMTVQWAADNYVQAAGKKD